MTSKKQNSKIREQINQLYEENELAHTISSRSRARSVTVGTAFGGSIEISMRGDYGNLWAVLQPVEVVEIIEQLASGIGLQIAMRPRQDFASWRGWNTDADIKYWAGAGQWQIEQAASSHKRMLKELKREEEEETKSLPPPKKSKSRKPKKIHDIKKEMKEKVLNELKVQEDIKSKVGREVISHLEDFRDEVAKNHKEYLDSVNPPEEDNE